MRDGPEGALGERRPVEARVRRRRAASGEEGDRGEGVDGGGRALAREGRVGSGVASGAQSTAHARAQPEPRVGGLVAWLLGLVWSSRCVGGARAACGSGSGVGRGQVRLGVII